MSLFHLELVERIEAILTTTCVESVLRPRGLLAVNLDLTVLHTDVRELILDEGERHLVPLLSNIVVLALADEKDAKASKEE